MDEGNYLDAIRVAKQAVQRLDMWHRSDEAPPFLMNLARVSIETGRLSQATSLLNTAEAILSHTGISHYDAAIVRERAALLYASGDYIAARAAAASAVRLSTQADYFSYRIEYCRSLQAFALLRSGRIAEAANLTTTALKVVPRKLGKHPFFVPRILYTACVVESWRGNSAAAKDLCSQGLEFAALTPTQVRDVSLGNLAWAEVHLQAGELLEARASAQKAADLIAKSFGKEHQDFIEALNLLAQISLAEGDVLHAKTNSAEALKIAAAFFGANSPGLAVQTRRSREIGLP